MISLQKYEDKGYLVQFYLDNRLVRRYHIKPPDAPFFCVSHGKRVPKDCPLTIEERRAYVKSGKIALVKMVKERLQLSLIETLALTNPWTEDLRSKEHGS